MQDLGALGRLLGDFGTPQLLNQVLATSLSYTPMMQFALVDQEKRLFAVKRYCFRGSVDDWIPISAVDSLKKQVRAYVKHLGQDSFYELY